MSTLLPPSTLAGTPPPPTASFGDDELEHQTNVRDAGLLKAAAMHMADNFSIHKIVSSSVMRKFVRCIENVSQTGC